MTRPDYAAELVDRIAIYDLYARYERNAELFVIDTHYSTGVRIDFEPGLQAATVKSKTLNISGMRQEDGSTKMAQAHGEYTDRVEKIDGDWKIVDRYWHNQGSTLGTQLAEGSGGMLGN